MPSYSLVTVSRGTVALEKGSSVVSFHSHPHLFQLAGPPSHTHFSAPQGGEGEACASDKKKTSEKKQRNRFLSFCAGEPARTSVCGVGDLSLSCRGGVGDPFLHGHRGGGAPQHCTRKLTRHHCGRTSARHSPRTKTRGRLEPYVERA